VTPWIESTPSGVYFGWASLFLPATHPDFDSTKPGPAVYPMVMSIGYNPFYKNKERSAEIHLLHKFAADFYGSHVRLLILGYIREELDYAGLEALIADINLDCDVARNSLAREAWAPRGRAVEDGKEGTLDCAWLVRQLEGDKAE